MIRRFDKMSPQEIFEFSFQGKKPEEITALDVYQTLYCPYEILIDAESNSFVSVKQLIKEGALTPGDLVLLALLHTGALEEENKKQDKNALQYRVRNIEAKKLMSIFPASEHVMIRKMKEDQYGTLYGENIWRFSENLLGVDDDYHDFIKKFNKEFSTSNQSRIFQYVNESMTHEFIDDEALEMAFNQLVNSNSRYKIAEQEDQTQQTLSDEEKHEIYAKTFRNVMFENMSVEQNLNVHKMMLSIAYRYLCDIVIEGKDSFASGNMLQEIDRIKRILSFVPEQTTIPLQLTPEDFSQEQLEQIKEKDLAIHVKALEKNDVLELIQQCIKEYTNQMKAEMMINPKTMYQWKKSSFGEIEFSKEDIIQLLPKLDEEDIQFIQEYSSNFRLIVARMRQKFTQLTMEELKALLELDMIQEKDIVDSYLEGKIHYDEESLAPYMKKENHNISYIELVDDCERARKIKDEEKRNDAYERLKRKTKVYLTSLKDERQETLEQESFDLVINRSQDYELNKEKHVEQGFSKEMIKDLYSLGLLTLDAIVALDIELLDYLFRSTDLPQEKTIQASQLIDLYHNGDISGADIKQYCLDGIIPLYTIEKIEDLNLSQDEAKKLLEADKLNPKNILALYQLGILSKQDLQDKVNTLPTEEDKYIFIYGNFADKGYEVIFNSLVNELTALQQSHTATGLGPARGIGPGNTSKRTPMPSQLRWRFLESLDPKFQFESLPDGHCAFIFPTYDRVLVEKMREMYLGEKCDAYGKATHGMTIDEYHLYKSQFVKPNPKNPTKIIVERPRLVALAKQKLIKPISHYPTTWGKDVVEYVYQQPIQQIQDLDKKEEIEFLVEELREEIENYREKQK